ncbi:transcriptional regulator with XRE-family HTH domain [Anaerosolibacter carboniphilus]|uniref:Transcriptional regulator with XRE-family HTH domain n=1 Tax=Anaerosolibacter carboniphilus TaxID=1417629 RepID=A0A841L533_9FIRM|nr:helix-turn-helix transcriptional regulator [Anaerosolibacter carboniphilus]MBB6218222.1 transcriptional regulator with XRE-family HTH domain [Anaerosolibacter carboniphilus]
MNFGERLKLLRDEKDLTQQDLADYLGVGRPTIAGYETKGKQPDHEKLIKLANYFNVSVDFLLGQADIRNSADHIKYAVKDDKELAEFWDAMKERESLQILFKQAKNLDDKDIKQMIRIIKAIEDEESNE